MNSILRVSLNHPEGWCGESQLLHYFACGDLHAAAVPPPTVVQASCLYNTQIQSHAASLQRRSKRKSYASGKHLKR
eukprot:1161339-Pelagomonas_calceolata.AAC.12